MMPDDDPLEREQLQAYLEYQRSSVLAIVDGLEGGRWHVPVVPSGWTVAGMVEHLGNAERHWFQEVVKGHEIDLPWDEGRAQHDAAAPLVCDRPAGDVRSYYLEQCRRSNDVLVGVSLLDGPKGHHGNPDTDEQVTNVREVILHMIEETAAHSGHLEIARELLDGQTGLGLR